MGRDMQEVENVHMEEGDVSSSSDPTLIDVSSNHSEAYKYCGHSLRAVDGRDGRPGDKKRKVDKGLV